jgi:hypothetical protein
MTTTLKPIARETLSTFRNRALVLELHSTYLKVRQKGKRTRYICTYDQIWNLGARNAAEEARRERNANKNTRKR